jgi:peptidyl-prolyl cis-trans isomerase-like 4
MSVLIETSLGDLVVDLEIDSCPRVCENFLKLCKIKYYGLNAFFNGKSGYTSRNIWNRYLSAINSIQRFHSADR